MPGTVGLFTEVEMKDLGIVPVGPVTSLPPDWLLWVSGLWLINH